MKRRIFRLGISIVLLGSAIPKAFPADANHGPEGGWQLAAQTRDAIIYSRPHENSSLREFKAVGSIDAPTSAVHAVIDDVAGYTEFMPFTVECRVLKKESDSIISYQRLAPKIVTDRDYTLRVWSKSWPAAGGVAFLNRWAQANELGPPEKKGVVRVKVCDGSWLLEPEGAMKTRATYNVYTDSGGAIPAFIANRASQTGISRLFAAVRKQVKNPKYTAGQ